MARITNSIYHAMSAEIVDKYVTNEEPDTVAAAEYEVARILSRTAKRELIRRVVEGEGWATEEQVINRLKENN